MMTSFVFVPCCIFFCLSHDDDSWFIVCEIDIADMKLFGGAAIPFIASTSVDKVFLLIIDWRIT